MTEASNYRVFLTNIGAADADKLARALVGEKLAACVNVIPGVKSYYHWKGELCVDDESTLIVKTTAPLAGALKAAILKHHPYSVPEILSLETRDSECGESYLKWIEEVTG